jgi:hypothetical protein
MRKFTRLPDVLIAEGLFEKPALMMRRLQLFPWIWNPPDYTNEVFDHNLPLNIQKLL